MADGLSRYWKKRASPVARTRVPLLLQEGERQAEAAAQAVALPCNGHRKINLALCLVFSIFVLISLSWPRCMSEGTMWIIRSHLP
jgi:hypothetical protein